MYCDGQSEGCFKQFECDFAFGFVESCDFGTHTFEGSAGDFHHVVFAEVFHDGFAHDVAFNFVEADESGNSATDVSDACDGFFDEVGSICFNENVAFESVGDKKSLDWDVGHFNFGSNEPCHVAFLASCGFDGENLDL